jgi:hypothetical protein
MVVNIWLWSGMWGLVILYIGTKGQRNHFYSDDKDNRFLCNVSVCLPHRTLSLPRRSTVIRIICDKDCWAIHHGYTLHSHAPNKTYFLQGFLDVDNIMLQEESLKDELAGTTAVAIILKDNKLYCVCTCVTMYVITSSLWTGFWCVTHKKWVKNLGGLYWGHSDKPHGLCGTALSAYWCICLSLFCPLSFSSRHLLPSQIIMLLLPALHLI